MGAELSHGLLSRSVIRNGRKGGNRERRKFWEVKEKKNEQKQNSVW